MRPKKIILLIDPNEDRQAITRFILEQHGYRVLSASSVYQAAEVAHDDHPDLLLGYSPISEQYLMELAGDLCRPYMFIAPPADSKLWPPMVTVLERIRIATARKRGPKKGCAPVRKSTIQPAPAEACA